ncbi:MAG: efflux RND transporter periplasmic adaptor subunit [Kiritimatiellia bacterium]|jgi:membrane fusion protein (multidrug efflux system)
MSGKSSAREAGKRLVAVVGVFVVGLMLTGCGKFGKAGGPPRGSAPEVAVMVIQPERLTLNAELPGRVSAYLVAEVRPQVSGIIQNRLFEEGGDVKAGDLLYQIDPALYEAALAKAEANLAAIRSRAERYKELVAVKAVSRQDYDDITAALKQAEAEVKSTRINLAYTGIAAPISGRIGKSSVTIGALATAYQPVPFATIQQLDQVYVDVPQSSVNLLRLKADMASGNLKSDVMNQTKVRLLLENGTSYPLEGVLKFSDVTVDPSTGSFILRMVFPNPDHILLPGMFVRAVIEEGVIEQALLVPQQGVARDPKGNPVALIVDAESKVQQRMLTLDRAVGNKWLVPAGLKPGDQVIVEGVQKARPGASVKVVPFDAGRKDGPEAVKAVQPAEKAK